MRIQRMIAVVMILGSSVLTGWASGDIAFPAILGMLGLLGTRRRFTWDIRPERHFITPLLLLVLAALFALHCHYARVRADQAAAFAWQTIARYFLASMILVLFLRPQRMQDRGQRAEDGGQTSESIGLASSVFRPPISSLPPSLGLFHLASVMAAGQVLLLEDAYVAFRLSELLSVTLVILYAATAALAVDVSGLQCQVSSVPPSHLTLGTSNFKLQTLLFALLIVAVNLGWIGGSLLYRRVEILNFLPAWLSRGGAALESTTTGAARVGFSASGALSTVLAIKEDADSAPVLTITGSNPTYLRAMVFETYGPSEWVDRPSKETLWHEQNSPFSMLLGGRTYVFPLNDDDPSAYVTVRHESSIGDVMFTPLGTCSVEAPLNMLMRDSDDTITSPGVRNRMAYRVAYTTSKTGNAPKGRMLADVPKHLDPRVQQKASRIFRGCNTTAEKINAVTQYFHTNYTYVLGLEVPADRDAMNYFLLEASSGYCEYFASGAALLLRLAGVPTRYVTGFLVTERGDDGRSWVARNMDAHAWAEAWDRERQQWVIVEATTQEGLGDVSLADQLARGAGSGAPFFKQLAEALYEYGLFGVIGRLFASYGLLTGVSLSMVFFGAALWLTRRTRRRGNLRSQFSNPKWVALHRMLAAVDRRARVMGYRRNPDETIHAFAGRIGRDGSQFPVPSSQLSSDSGQPTTVNWVVDWYLDYADLRYGKVIDAGRVERLHRLAQELRSGR